MSKNIVIIGDGMVGSTIAYTIFLKGWGCTITLIDVNEKKAEADALDMMHTTPITGDEIVKSGSYDAIEDADIVIITASVPGKFIKSRNDLLAGNKKLMEDICASIKPHLNDRAIFIVVSNPVDVMAYWVWKLLDIGDERIIGSGTLLDSMRFSYYVAQALGEKPEDVEAMVIGEHGDSQVPLFSSIKVRGIPLSDDSKLDKKKIAEDTRRGGNTISDGKGYTNFGIAVAVSTIVESLLFDTGRVLPVSVHDDTKTDHYGRRFGDYAERELFISLSTHIVKPEGRVGCVDGGLRIGGSTKTTEEWKSLTESVIAVLRNIEELEKIE